MQKKILVVDDIEINRLILSDLFSAQFDVIEAENGRAAMDILEKNKEDISIVLLDLMMPIMDGFAVLNEMNNSAIIKTIPVILITGEDDDEKTLLGYKLGVSDYIKKPFNSDIVYRRVNNVVDLYSHKKNLEEKLKEQKEELEGQARRLKQFNQFVIDILSTTVEFRSFESGEHIKRIRMLTHILLESVKEHYPFSAEEVEVIGKCIGST